MKTIPDLIKHDLTVNIDVLIKLFSKPFDANKSIQRMLHDDMFIKQKKELLSKNNLDSQSTYNVEIPNVCDADVPLDKFIDWLCQVFVHYRLHNFYLFIFLNS